MWPDNKRFAFTIFDDTDSQTLANGRPVYDFLAGLGLRTTKSVWISGHPEQVDFGQTCDDPEYLAWVRSLQDKGFEIAWHMAGAGTSTREETIAGLDRFEALFGHPPYSMANHYECEENIYFGDARVSGLNRLFYNLVTRFQNWNRFKGHIEEHNLFWGDECVKRIKYLRNFVYGDINTIKLCPQMPYHDPARPHANYWFASSEGAEVEAFNRLLAPENQERLEEEGGCCIVYTHFGLGFTDPETGDLNPVFREQMESLAQRRGWFVPVTELLDYLLKKRGPATISARERARLERQWIWHKLFHGSA